LAITAPSSAGKALPIRALDAELSPHRHGRA